MARVMVALDRGVLDRAVHPLDSTVGPWAAPFGQAMFDLGLLAGPFKRVPVLDRYFEAKAHEDMKSIYDAKSRSALHIRPKLGPMRVVDLTVDKVRRRRDAMVAAPKRRWRGKFAKTVDTAPVN